MTVPLRRLRPVTARNLTADGALHTAHAAHLEVDAAVGGGLLDQNVTDERVHRDVVLGLRTSQSRDRRWIK